MTESIKVMYSLRTFIMKQIRNVLEEKQKYIYLMYETPMYEFRGLEKDGFYLTSGSEGLNIYFAGQCFTIKLV